MSQQADLQEQGADSLYQAVGPDAEGTLNFLADVELQIKVELGQAVVPIKRMLELRTGSVVPLTKLPEEPLDVRVNNKLVAQGEAVIVNDKFGVRVTQIVSPEGELEGLAKV